MLSSYIKNIDQTQVVIFDIDGCIADCSHRLHLIEGDVKKDWDGFFDRVDGDSPILHNLLLLSLLAAKGAYIVLMTGRPESTRGKTAEWFGNLGPDVTYHMMLMRPTGDYRPDDQVKREMVRFLRGKGFEIIMAFDDRQNVVDMFIKEGIPCLHVRSPDPQRMELVKGYEAEKGGTPEKA